MKKVLRLNGVPLRAPPYGVPPYAKEELRLNEKGKKGRGNEKTEFLFKGLRFGLNGILLTPLEISRSLFLSERSFLL